MALDYSKLSTAELEAIANDDFSKLSNRTLRLIANEPEPKTIKDNVKDFGRATASLADTALNAVTGTLDYAAYPLARAFGRSPEQATQETTSPKDVVGRAFGVTGTPAYENAPLRSAGRAIGETLGQNIIQPLSQMTGLPQQDVGSMLGTATLAAGPMVPKVASATVSGAKKVAPLVTAPIDIGKGFYQGVRGVEPGTQKSAVVPLRDTYYPPEMVQAYMRGDIDLPTLQAGQQPSKSLFATPEQQSALRMAERMPGEPNVPLIPVQGKGMQAFGERVGREYVTDPYRAAADIGLSVVAGMPLPLSAAQRALQARQSRTLSQAANFDPMFRQKLMQDVSQPTPTPTPMQAPVAGPVSGPVAPGNYPLTVQGPGQQLPPSVMTAPDLSRRVSIEGQPFNLPNQINTTNSQTARPQQTPHQMALQKTQEIVEQQAPVQQAPVQQAPVQQAPVQQAPVQQAPVATTPVIRTTPAPLQDILAKTRQLTKEESKLIAKQKRADEKAKSEGKTVTKEPIHPEIERITKEAEPLTQDYIKSLDLDNKTLIEKDAIKQSLITEERKLKSAISDNRTTKALNNDEIEALMKRYHSVSKARDVIQNELVSINSLKERVKKLTEMVEYNKNRPKGKVAQTLGSGRTAEADLPIYQKQLDDILAKQPKTLEEKVDVVKSQGEARRNQARGKPDVSEMKIGKEELPTGIKSLSKETTGEIYPSKDAYDKAMTFKILQEDVPRASYIEGDKLITVFPQNIPKEIIRSTGISPTATIIRDAKTGKVIKD